MLKSTIPAYITSLIRHFEDLRDGTHGGYTSRRDKQAHFEKAVATAGSRRPPSSHRNEHELAARHRATHLEGATTHGCWRAERILGSELA